MRYVILVVLAMAGSAVLAHSESGSAPEPMLDCSNPPMKLKSRLPAPVDALATIECGPSGQAIVARDGWSWRYPGSYFDRPTIPAYSPVESRSSATGRYFVRFRVRELKQEEIVERHQAFRKIVTYTAKAPPRHLYKIVATNDIGHSMDIYFGLMKADEGWVVSCAPECAPEFLILIQKQ